MGGLIGVWVVEGVALLFMAVLLYLLVVELETISHWQSGRLQRHALLADAAWWTIVVRGRPLSALGMFLLMALRAFSAM